MDDEHDWGMLAWWLIDMGWGCGWLAWLLTGMMADSHEHDSWQVWWLIVIILRGLGGRGGVGGYDGWLVCLLTGMMADGHGHDSGQVWWLIVMILRDEKILALSENKIFKIFFFKIYKIVKKYWIWMGPEHTQPKPTILNLHMTKMANFLSKSYLNRF